MYDVNFEETVRRNRLVADNSHILDTLLLYILAGVVSYAIYLGHPDIGKDIYSIIYNFVVTPIAAIILGYILYKKTIEQRLFKVHTPYDIEKTKDLVLGFFDKNNWNIEYANNDCMIATQSEGMFGEMQATMIFTEGCLLLNVINSTRGRNSQMPLFLDDTGTRDGIAWTISRDGKPEEGYVYQD